MAAHHHHDTDFEWQILVHGHDGGLDEHRHEMEDELAWMQFEAPCLLPECLAGKEQWLT